MPEKTCKYGHAWLRTRFGQCAECKKISNSVSLRLRRGDLWRHAPKSDENRAEEWAAYCERIDAAIAETRAREGFDGRETRWKTLETLRPAVKLTKPAWRPVRRGGTKRRGPILCRNCGAVWNGGLCCLTSRHRVAS